jgi:hypothetical protein
MRDILRAGAAILPLVLLGPAASAQTPQPSTNPCGPRDSILQALERIGEVPVGIGIAGQEGKAVIELTVAPDGSWSVLVSDVDGQTCLVLAGKEWDFAKPQPVGEPS